MSTKSSIPAAAAVLGYGGVMPFLALAVNYLAAGPLFPGFALQAFLAYSAVVLGFIGGVRWGAALNLEKSRSRELAVSVVPALWAVVCMLLPGPAWIVGGLLAGYIGVGAIDLAIPPPTAPAWMTRLRLHLTAAVAVCHLLMLAAFYA